MEAACELIGIAGESLEKAPKSKARLDKAFEHLTRLSNSAKVYPRCAAGAYAGGRGQGWPCPGGLLPVRSLRLHDC